MSYFSVGASETLTRFVYPPFVALWGKVRGLSGRDRRRTGNAGSAAKSAENQRRKNLWKESHDR
jgi:hypothetical protein